VGKGKNSEKDQVGAHPILSGRERGGEEGGDPAEKGQTGEGERNGEKKELVEGVCPAEEWLIRGELVT
jgi:hypothetical protein